jgi:hypothetical protein
VELEPGLEESGLKAGRAPTTEGIQAVFTECDWCGEAYAHPSQFVPIPAAEAEQTRDAACCRGCYEHWKGEMSNAQWAKEVKRRRGIAVGSKSNMTRVAVFKAYQADTGRRADMTIEQWQALLRESNLPNTKELCSPIHSRAHTHT